LQLRSLEIFDSFGFADRVVKEANHMIEVCVFCFDELKYSKGLGLSCIVGRAGRT
jgi:hypothetical protein